jgi:hypothetical protein
LHELGKDLAASGLVAAGPQDQALIALPPSVVPTKAVVPVWMGVSDRALLVSLVLPRKVLALPTTVITPLALTDRPDT